MKKRIHQNNEEASRNQTLQQESHERDNKPLGCLPCTILGIILKMDMGEMQTNKPKDKKVDSIALCFISERRDTLYVSRRTSASRMMY